MTALEIATAVSLATSIRRLAAGTGKPLDLVSELLKRIEELEPELKAWVSIDADAALAAASRLGGTPAEARGALWGVPVGVKDIIDVAGMRAEYESMIFDEAAPATADAACVEALRSADGIVLGKTVTTEFGYFSPGPTSNPHRPFGGTELTLPAAPPVDRPSPWPVAWSPSPSARKPRAR